MDNRIREAIGILYEMDNFVLSVMDDETWLTYGVPDGEFTEETKEQAMDNLDDHAWLITDFDNNFSMEDFSEFVHTFKGVTRNSRDYDQTTRANILQASKELLRADNPPMEEGMSSPKYLTREQLDKFVSNKMNEGLLMEGPMKQLKQKGIIKVARDPAKSASNIFIVDGKEYKFKDAMKLSDEQLVNACVIDKYGYYIRKGTQDVYHKRERRRDPETQDIVKDNKKFQPKKSDVKAQEREAKVKQPKMHGDYSEWTYSVNGKAYSYSDLVAKYKSLSKVPTGTKVYDKKKKEFSWADAQTCITSQQGVEKQARDKRDQKIANKEQKQVQKARNKEDAKAKKDAIKSVRTANKNAAPKGKLTISHKDGGNSISVAQYKKLSSKEKQNYTITDSTGKTFTYNQILASPLRKQLNASFDRDSDNDVFVESFTPSRLDMEYDDDVSLLNRDMDYDDENLDDDFS